MSELNQLYKQAVLKHNRNPNNYGRPEQWTHHAEGLNAVCGDQVNVFVQAADGLVEAVYFSGESCAISMASSSMMTALVADIQEVEVRALFASFKRLMDRNESEYHDPALGEINALASVKKFPSRIKSATLCWHALIAALDGADFATTE